ASTPPVVACRESTVRRSLTAGSGPVWLVAADEAMAKLERWVPGPPRGTATITSANTTTKMATALAQTAQRRFVRFDADGSVSANDDLPGRVGHAGCAARC